ncbi:hypothetical protein IEQ34_001107 [Dendrobium chrysotoxum]|uniref:Uncharacterized protein n=1 Tax=Dendrobium chrysotoxum TaxID=161865 RepID=A0AAV7HP50_DENCH|nr:hypothetical protein IEQ34_001107 [Dendrobium chrysotoxum]
MFNESLKNNSETSKGFIFRNHLSKFSYQISTRAQGNEENEQCMLTAIKDMSENINLILYGKRNNHNSPKVKDPPKQQPKGISNARLKSHWEKKKKPKSILRCTLLYL